MLPRLLPGAASLAIVMSQTVENIMIVDASRQDIALFDVLGLAT